ncbi:MAG: 1-deoxy-D-xylulose-5-phosphate reductoisomerase [Acidobacteriota bacterium]
MSVGVTVLGSTGSVGETTLNVLRYHKDSYHVVGLAAGHRVERLIEQIREFNPVIVSIREEKDARAVKEAFPSLEVISGKHGVTLVAGHPDARVVVAAIVGSEGLAPTYKAVQAGKRVGVANKESLVMAGRFFMETARRTGAEILPIDSEHCAVFQCLRGESVRYVRRVILTASGGALRNMPIKKIENASLEDVLAHPTWKMGRKITVDSATMMNKGLEVIEANRLFGVPIEKIDVVLHPQSIVHSMVEYQDGSVMAQLADTDMALPVQYALTYPARKPGAQKFLDLVKSPPLEFYAPDTARYPCLGLAREAAGISEAHVIALNAANEIAVRAYLEGRIRFGEIARIIRRVLDRTPDTNPGAFQEVYPLHEAGSNLARKIIDNLGE